LFSLNPTTLHQEKNCSGSGIYEFSRSILLDTQVIIFNGMENGMKSENSHDAHTLPVWKGEEGGGWTRFLFWRIGKMSTTLLPPRLF